jgi:adenylate kinase
MKIIIMGPQGSGKGTQAKLLAEKYGIVHVSPGALYREHIRLGTEIGKTVEEPLSRGEMAPDEITNIMVKDRLSHEDAKDGWILDGYPRNTYQADFLDGNEQVDHVIVVDVSEEVSVKRISNRRVCVNCKKNYGLDVQPQEEDVCDECGGQLIQRDDDTPEAVKRRLELYFKITKPVIDHYREKGLVKEFNGEQDVQPLFEEITQTIGE